MKIKKLKTYLLLTAFISGSSGLMAETMRMYTPPASEYSGVSADGTSLTAFGANAWTFAVGTFGSGFDASNYSTWESSFSTLATASWIVSPPFAAGRLDSEFNMNDNSFTGSQGYIWGYNSQAVDVTSEWILVTNTAWVFPEQNELSLSPQPQNSWNLADASNTWLVGIADADGFQMQAIPEPSTYALIFGLGILGFLGYRRVRK